MRVRERIEETVKECSRVSLFVSDAKIQTVARERGHEEKKAGRSGTRKGRCEYMMRISLVQFSMLVSGLLKLCWITLIDHRELISSIQAFHGSRQIEPAGTWTMDFASSFKNRCRLRLTLTGQKQVSTCRAKIVLKRKTHLSEVWSSAIAPLLDGTSQQPLHRSSSLPRMTMWPSSLGLRKRDQSGGYLSC